jgi:hypothetical protein
MHHDDPQTWYIHRNLDAPIRDAVPALDAFAWQASLRPASAYARLLARPEPHEGQVAATAPARAFRGQIRVGVLGPAVPVELDLTPWSDTNSVLGLRPAGRRPPGLRRTNYFDTSHSLLDDFAQKLDFLVNVERGPRHDAVPSLARVLLAPERPAVAPLTDRPHPHDPAPVGARQQSGPRTSRG